MYAEIRKGTYHIHVRIIIVLGQPARYGVSVNCGGDGGDGGGGIVVVMRRVKQKPHKVCKHRANIQDWSFSQHKQFLGHTCHHIGQEFYSIRLRISSQSGHRFFVTDRRSCPFFRIRVFFCANKKHRYSYKYSNIYPTRYNFTQFIYIWKLFYMFRVVPLPIIRSTYNCIYSIWYLSDRYCYLPL